MFEKLKDAFTKQRHAQEQTSAKQYESLVKEAFADTLSEKDVGRVDQILRECGRTLQQLEVDVNRQREMKSLEAVAETLPTLQANHKALTAKHAKMSEEFVAARRKGADALDALMDEIIATQNSIGRADAAREELVARFAAESSLGAKVLACRTREELTGKLAAARGQLAKSEKELADGESKLVSLENEKKSGSRHESDQQKIASYKTMTNRLRGEVAALTESIAALEKEIADIPKKESKLAPVVS